MSDRLNGGNTTLYPPVEQMLGFDDWSGTVDVRIKRLQQFVFPRLERAKEEAKDSVGTQFLQTAIRELSTICQTQFTGYGRFPSEIPVYCLLDEEEQQEPKYNLNGTRGVHNEATMTAAQTVIDAICPELGIRIDDDKDSLMTTVNQAKALGYAKFSNYGGDFYAAMCGTIHPIFSTILPGINLSMSLRNNGRYVSLDWQVM